MAEAALTPEAPTATFLHQVRNGRGGAAVARVYRSGPLRPRRHGHRIPDWSGRDVTEAHERQRELLTKEAAMAASVDGIAIVDPEGRFEYVNRAFAAMFGYGDSGELAGHPYAELAQGDLVLGGILAELEAQLLRDGHWFGEIRCLRRDGRAFQAQVSASVAFDDEGRLLCTLLSAVDVTERRQTEEALKLSRGKLQEAIEFMPDATFIVDSDRQVVAWNRAMETLTGIRREEVMGTRDYGRAFVKFVGAFPVLVDLIDLSTEELARTYPGVRRFGETLYFETPVPSLRGGRGGHLWGKASPLSDRDGSGDRSDPDPARHLGLEAGRGVVPGRDAAGEPAPAARRGRCGAVGLTVRGGQRARRVPRRTFIYLYRPIVVAAFSPPDSEVPFQCSNGSLRPSTGPSSPRRCSRPRSRSPSVSTARSTLSTQSTRASSPASSRATTRTRAP